MAINEQEKREIEGEAKKILDKFGKTLEKIKFKEKKGKGKTGGFRKEEEGAQSDSEFRRGVFENAPNKEGDFIIGEKKKW